MRAEEVLAARTRHRRRRADLERERGRRHELREAGPDSSAWRGAELLVAAVASGYAAELAAAVDTADDHSERLQLAAELALDRCPVVAALDVPLSHTVRLERARLQEVRS